MHLTILHHMVLNLNQPIHTQVKMEHVHTKNQQPYSQIKVGVMLHQTNQQH